jgi:uncharacterized protein YjbI with pentapeptide repeats
MKAKELLSRYRQGERNFRGVDLSGEALRWANLEEIDLIALHRQQMDFHRQENASLTRIA